MVPELEALSLAHRIQSRLERAGFNIYVGRTREGYMVDLLEVTTMADVVRSQARGKASIPGSCLVGRIRVIRDGGVELGEEHLALRYEGGAEAILRKHAPGLTHGLLG